MQRLGRTEASSRKQIGSVEKQVGGDAEVGAEGFEVGGREAAFAFEDAVGDRAIYLQDFGEAVAAEVVLCDEILEEFEAVAGGE